jgi:hypothetical protein
MGQIPTNHFHIQWAHTLRLDWQCFDTIADANTHALELSLPGETFRIVELSTDCHLRDEKDS